MQVVYGSRHLAHDIDTETFMSIGVPANEGADRRPSLDQTTLEKAVAELAERDADLAAIVERFGAPPLWDRPPGFGTLVHIVLEQQVRSPRREPPSIA